MSELELVETPVAEHYDIKPTEEGTPDLERRRFRRKSPVNRNLYGFFRYHTDKLVDIVIAHPAARVVLALAVILSLSAIWWTFHYRVNSLEASQQDVTERARLGEHLDFLKEQWSANELESVLGQISQAESRVFPGYTHLAEWLRQTHGAAQVLGLKMQYQLGSAFPSKVKDVLEVPITVDASAVSAPVDQAYLRVLEFVRHLIGGSWYLQVHSARATSDGDGLQELSLELRVWVHKAPHAQENDAKIIE